jgi:hypothetical protein
MSEIIEEFAKEFIVNDWEFWKEEDRLSDTILIAAPSRIVALVDIPKAKEEMNWETYTIISEPTKKMGGCLAYNGKLFSMHFLEKAFKFLKPTVEICYYGDIAILFKLTETIALAIACKIDEDGFYYNDEGVNFVDVDWEETKEEWRTTMKAQEFIKWSDGMAKRKHTGKSGEWYEEVYKFEKFFEKEEDMGDFLDI